MPRKSDRPETRRHVWLPDEDWEFLVEYYGKGSAHPVGVSFAIKTILAAHIKQLKAKAGIHAKPVTGNTEQSDITDGLTTE